MQTQDTDTLPLSEIEQIFSGLAFGIDASMWLSGREMFFNNSEPLRARTRFALGHYLFFGDPTCSLPALGYGSDKEREWVIRQILIERQGLINEPSAVFARRWRQRAGECVPITVDSISTQQLKASIIACCAYAAMPPSTDDANKLDRLIDQLRKELGRRLTGPKRKKEEADSKLTVH
ncbi:MAG TPA: hypothetical protein V6C69_07620 [Trichormus sp.]|jgi:hypothetical protein